MPFLDNSAVIPEKNIITSIDAPSNSQVGDTWNQINDENNLIETWTSRYINNEKKWASQKFSMASIPKIINDFGHTGCVFDIDFSKDIYIEDWTFTFKFFDSIPGNNISLFAFLTHESEGEFQDISTNFPPLPYSSVINQKNEGINFFLHKSDRTTNAIMITFQAGSAFGFFPLETHSLNSSLLYSHIY
jgi:hypothetical protein